MGKPLSLLGAESNKSMFGSKAELRLEVSPSAAASEASDLKVSPYHSCASNLWTEVLLVIRRVFEDEIRIAGSGQIGSGMGFFFCSASS